METIRNDSAYDRFMDSVASMHSVADLIRVSADAASCKSVLERLMIKSHSLIDKILELEKRASRSSSGLNCMS